MAYADEVSDTRNDDRSAAARLIKKIFEKITMIRKFIYPTVILFCIKAQAQDTTTSNIYSLKQCIEIAVKNNLNVKQGEYVMENTKINWIQAKGNMLPFISGNIGHGQNRGRSIDPFTNQYLNQQYTIANYGVNASVILWNGNAVRNNAKQNELSYEAAKMDWQQLKDNITINVILAYLQVLNNAEQLRIATVQTAVTRGQADRLDVLHENGAVLPATYYDMKGQLSGDEVNLLDAKNNFESSKLDLIKLMNLPYQNDFEIEILPGTDTPESYGTKANDIYGTALTNFAFIKAADLRKESAVKGTLASKGALLPSLSLNGNLGTNYSSAAFTSTKIQTQEQTTDAFVNVNGSKSFLVVPTDIYRDDKIKYFDQWKNNFNSQISIGLQIPILNGLQAKSRLNQAKILEQRTGYEAKTAKVQLQQDIEQAYLNMQTAFDKYRKLEQQVADYTESFRTAEVRFNAGAVTSVDYLLAKNNLDRAKSNFVANKYDYILRTKILDFYRGSLSY